MDEPRWYSIAEAATRLRVSHDTISRLIARGELPAIRVSTRIVRIPAPAMHRYETGLPVERRTVVYREVDVVPVIGEDEGIPAPQASER